VSGVKRPPSPFFTSVYRSSVKSTTLGPVTISAVNSESRLYREGTGFRTCGTSMPPAGSMIVSPVGSVAIETPATLHIAQDRTVGMPVVQNAYQFTPNGRAIYLGRISSTATPRQRASISFR